MLIGLSGFALAKMLNIDPFAKFKDPTQSGGLDLNLGKFAFKAYSNGKEVASGDVDKGKVFKGTRTVDMEGVHNGTITTEEGDKLGFQAPAATYDINTKDMVAPMGVQLNTKDAQINAPAMRYNNATQTVVAPGTLHG
ncbi:MAG: LPS export ABC transporter periplasmic protein LptC, partial [Armatimonadota bacterium]